MPVSRSESEFECALECEAEKEEGVEKEAGVDVDVCGEEDQWGTGNPGENKGKGWVEKSGNWVETGCWLEEMVL